MPSTKGLVIPLACAALLAAITSGFVSQADATNYRWERGIRLSAPGQLLDSSLSFTPLLLSSWEPQEIEVRWSCIGRKAHIGEPSIIAATTRGDTTNGFAVVSPSGSAFQLFVGESKLAEVTTPVDVEPNCSYTAAYERNIGWTLFRGRDLLSSGTTETPLVTGVRSDFDPLRSNPDAFVSVEITTIPHGPSSSPERSALRGISLVLALAAAVVVFRETRTDKAMMRTSALPVSATKVHPSRWLDHVVVTAVLLIWWLLGPALFDDGWLLATVRNFRASAVFSSYFDTNNAVLPLGYIHDAIVYLFYQVSDSLLSLRLPALLAGIGTWLVCRAIVDAAMGRWEGASAFGIRMTTAAIFLLSWISWNITLRPEPLIAFFVSVSLWAAVKWHIDSNPTFVLIGLTATALALSMGVSGVVGIAPWIFLLRRLFLSMVRERNDRPLLVVSVLISSTVLVLAVLSSGDAEFWSAARDSFRAEEHHNAGLLDEPTRYLDLFRVADSNSVRQLSVLLPLIAVLMYFVRPRLRKRSPSDVPVLASLIAILLLAFTPSKWIWHFGAMTPLFTAAVALEANRWKQRGAAFPKAGVLVVAASLSIISVLVWDGWFGWNLMALGDLQELGAGFSIYELPEPALLAAAVMGWALTSTIFNARRGASAPHRLQGFSQRALPASAFLAIGVAILVFVTDGLLLSHDWSLARQNLAQLSGVTCGAAEHAVVHLGEPLALERTPSLALGGNIPEPVAGYKHVNFELTEAGISFPSESSSFRPRIWESNSGGGGGMGWFASPWFGLEGLDPRRRDGVLIQAKGHSSFDGNDLLVQLAHRSGSQVEYGPLMGTGTGRNTSTWESINIGLHLAAPTVSAVRIVAINGSTGPEGPFAFSEPYVYESHSSLEQLGRSRGGPVLVAPQISVYFPCFEQPAMKAGQAGIPSLVLSTGGWPLGLPGSPYRYLRDIATLTPVPVSWKDRSESPPFDVLLVEPKTSGDD